MTAHNECVTAILNELDKYGLDGRVIDRGKHLEIEWYLPSGSRRSHFTACTPSDWRAPLNERARIRRLMRDDKIEIPTKTAVTFKKAMALPKSVPAPDERIKTIQNDLDAAVDLIFELCEQLTTFADKLNSLQVITTVSFVKAQEAVVDTPVTPVQKAHSAHPTLVLGAEFLAQSYRKHARGASVQLVLDYLKDCNYHQIANIIKDTKLGKQITNQALMRLRKRGLVENGLRGMWRKIPAHRVPGDSGDLL